MSGLSYAKSKMSPYMLSLFDTPLVNLDPEAKEMLFMFLVGWTHSDLVSLYYEKFINNKAKGGTIKKWESDGWIVGGVKYPAHRKLFHANSVTTAVNFIRKGGLFSRQYGLANGLQTAQKSDLLDQEMGIFGDIFFDNMDIPYSSSYKTSFYGPVMFVMNPKTLQGRFARITKVNPAGTGINSRGLKYYELFYISANDLSEGISAEGRKKFLNNYGHHVTIYNTDILDFRDDLYAIYVERNPDKSGQEIAVKELLEAELRKKGIDVPVVIRPYYPNITPAYYGMYATGLDELWKMP